MKFLDDYFDGKGDGVPTPSFSIDSYLKLMEDEEIDYSVLSISSPHLSAAPDKEMLELTEEANTYAAEMVTAHQDKLDYFASLPLPLVEESIQMIDRALDDQHALGFTLPTNARGIYLGDDRLDKILAKLDERHALVAIHPNEPKPVNDSIKEKYYHH